MGLYLKLILILTIFFITNLTHSKPYECKHPRPKVNRIPYKAFEFNKKNWEDQFFSKPEHLTFNIKNKNLNFTHELPVISVVVFKNTSWKNLEVIKQVDSAAKVLNQCGLRLNKAHLINVEAPNKTAIIRRHRACFDPEPDGHHHITNTIPYLPGIRIFYIKRFIIGPEAFAAADYTSINTPAENTIWLQPRSPDAIPAFDPNYQVLAHEIGHILLNSGHIKDKGENIPNLMSGKPSLLNNELTFEQCELLRSHRLVKKILN